MGQTCSTAGGNKLKYARQVELTDEYAIFRSTYSNEEGTLVTALKDGNAQTSYDIFQASVKKFGPRPFLGTREVKADGSAGAYRFQTFNEVKEVSQALAAGLVGREAFPVRKFTDEKYQQDYKFIGVMSKNRAEYFVTMQAAYSQGVCLVPLYDTLGAEVVDFIVNQTQLSCVCAEGSKVKTLVDVAPKCESLKIIVSYDASACTDELVEKAKAAGVTLLSYDAVVGEGRAKPVEPSPPKSEDVQTICYTSGTTGMPKGAMITHKQVLATVQGLSDVLAANNYHLSEEDVHISYLPYAHIFERAVCETLTMFGTSMGYYQGDTLKLLDDIAELKPTVFFSVPRLYNRIFEKLQGRIEEATGIKKSLVSSAIATKLANLKSGGALTHWFYDRVVCSKFKAALGGRVRFLFTGSAPMSSTVQDFLKVAFCVPMFEGYGMTETCCAGGITMACDPVAGHVGGLIGSVEMKVISLPEMNYTVRDVDDEGRPTPRGELCLRGPSVFVGYFLAPEKTKEAVDADGWLHTGDVCRIEPTGAIKIIDRAKNIFKLAQGEYVALEKIENVYVQAPAVAQSFVFGYSTKRFLVAVVVPNWDEFVQPWAKEQGKAFDKAALAKDPELIKAVAASMEAVAKKNGLNGFERVKAITLAEELFTVENNMLTPSFKLKRHVAKEVYKSDIDRMYSEIGDTI